LAGFAPDELRVCAYRRNDPAGPVSLTYAAELDDRAAAAYGALTTVHQQVLRCASGDPRGFEWVVLRFEGEDPFGPGNRVFREVVVHLSGTTCPRVQVDAGTAVALSPDVVRPWAVGGIPAVLYGPTGGKGAMLDSFIGPLG
jgi:hypothetical protein